MNVDQNAPSFVVLDWGTTSLRAWLLDIDGKVLGERQAPRGIMQISGGNFRGALQEIIGDWLSRWPHLRPVAAGMIGSAQGWVEAPYLPCPAGPDDLGSGLVSTPGGALLVVPGVAQHGEAANVMRGEETQIAGALAQYPELRAASRIVLPGTHSKWADVREGRIHRFDTFMTGELFAVLRQHSILGRLAGGTPPDDKQAAAAFTRGVEAVKKGGRVAPLLFSTRALALLGNLPAETTLDYLSGLLIGEELSCALETSPAPDALIGDAALCHRYHLALSIFGVNKVPEVKNAAIAGLWRIASRAGLGPAEKELG